MSLFTILFLSDLWASSAAGVEEHAASVTQVIFPLINFLIFFYLIKRFLLPMIKDHLRTRREEIVAALGEADESKRNAEVMIRDYRARLARMEEEAKKLREMFRAEGEREKAKLLREAEELAAKIRADADFLAEQELKLARQKVREEIARLAQAAAQKVIQDHLTPADQKRLVEEFLSGVGQQ